MSGRADTSTRDCLAKFKNIQIFAQCRDRKQNLQNLILCAFFAPSKENLNKKEENKHHSEGVKEKEGMITLRGLVSLILESFIDLGYTVNNL